MSDHAKGLLFTTLAMLVITPDALLIRLVETDVWTLTFWRGVLSATGLLIGIALFYRRRFFAVMLAPGIPGLWIGGLFGVTTVIFVWGITHTSAANTLLIISTGSMFAAGFSWLILKEVLARRTVLAIAGTLVGLLIIVGGDLGGGSLEGDLAALAVAAFSGLNFTLIRRYAVTDMVPTLTFGGIVTAVIALLVSAPVALHGTDPINITGMSLVMLPLAFALQFIGARYLPAPEVSLFFLLEAVLAPLLVWAVINEHPGTQTFYGGAVIITALALHAVWGLRRVR
ncbi:MAG: DMT family transporter [Alphaproteobacteria bacterium]|nr:DMT family transporter [Rhodospirillaceae bacterium]MDG2480846.1 DMT family transporter [Alphaproteobacteria bacterium]MBT6205815.1 DMT family transporter [Rhodospirillaceae bacterium]MBT6511127.1 DMT family transporter [Rhodospirillaceae bacterium]MBT7612531.1 DMT family transporter [Rhodospirillaceae bacterium]